MRKIYYTLFLAFGLPLCAVAQSRASVNGSVNMSPLLQLDVSYPNNLQLEFDDLTEFSKGKVYQSCINLSIKSNAPWVVSVRSGTQSFSAPANSGSAIPSNLLSLKPSHKTEFIPVTNVPTPLLYSENDNVENQYTLDLKMSTPWNAMGGQYGLNFIFSISPQ